MPYAEAPGGRGPAAGRDDRGGRPRRWWRAMAEFVMPRLGADMEAGTLVAWRKHPGDAVRRGEIIAEVETEKGVIDVEIFDTGVVERSWSQPGQKVPVGRCWPVIRVEARRPRPGAPAPAVRPPAARPRNRSAAPADPVGRAARSRRRPGPATCASPRWRGSVAAELGIDPTTVAAPAPAARSLRRTSSGRGGPAPPATARAGRRPAGRDAPGDRGGDGPLQARDPPLLPVAPPSTCTAPWTGWRRRTAADRSTERLLPACCC